MPSQAEAHFREAQRQLDAALQRDWVTISGQGIELHVLEQDNRDVCLSWSLRFAARSTRGSEVEKVWGTVSIYEGNPTIVKVWRRAEIFEVGARLRWAKTVERDVPLQSLLRVGLRTTIDQEIADGKVAARSAG